MSREMHEKTAFDEETGEPLRTFTIRLQGRSDDEINADIDEMFKRIGKNDDPR